MADHHLDTPERAVHPWHLVVAWLVAMILAAIAMFFLIGGLTGVVGGADVAAGLIMTTAGVLLLAWTGVYARGVRRFQRTVADRSR